MSKEMKGQLKLGFICFAVPCLVIALLGLTIGVGNGNVDLHWPSLYEVWRFLIDIN